MAKIALLIGTSEYATGLETLPSAVRDAEAMQRVLQHPDIGGFATSDVTVLQNPDRQLMEEAIEHLFADRQKDDLLLLFFSGHGMKDETGKLFLATSTTRKNARGELVRSSAVAASFVHDSMSRSRSKRQVVILDSCFSGAFPEGLAAKDDGTIDIRTQLGGEGRAILTSSSATEYSFDEKGADLSIYTQYLVEGMTTGAADLDDDGVVSIDELHAYASTKVRDSQPAMKPEIYSIREGFKIRLTKVPPGDPVQKYRQEVKRYLSRGEVSFVGRKTLDALRSRLGLSAADATTIEDEMLAAARQAFHDKLQQYERDFTEALQQEVALDEADLTLLRQNLQHILGLRPEDTRPIEVQVRSRIAADTQHRQQYEQALAEALRQEYPLSPATRQRLQQMQQDWQLSDADIEPIERRITAELEAYRHKLRQYEQALARATQQKYALSEAQRHALLEEQRTLCLTDEDIAPLEAQMHAEIEAYQQKLQQYEQVLIHAMQDEYPLGEEVRQELGQFQRVLGLEDEEVAHIEANVVRQHAPTEIQPGFSTPTPNGDDVSETQPAYATPQVSTNTSRVAVGVGIAALVACVLIYFSLLRPSPSPLQLPQHVQTQSDNVLPDSHTTLQMTPTDFNKRGNEKYDTNNYQGAIEDDTAAIKLDTNYAEADHNRGVARTAQGDKPGAGEDYQTAADQGDVSGQTNLLRMDELARDMTQPKEPLKAECPPDELSTLGKVAPMYVQWHTSRHAQWEEDEFKDPILEALAKEEEGQEGTAQGRGPVFQRMLPILEAADSAKAERVKSGLRASAVLGDLRAGKEARHEAVDKLDKEFRASLTCLSRSLKAIEYLTKLNDMPSFPDPIVDPEGEIGRFLGAYMRKHVIVNHDQLTHQIVIKALNAHKGIQPSAKGSFSRTASLVLIEKALENLDPKIAAEVRQGRGDQARKEFLDGEPKLQQRQAEATKDYEDSYKILSKEYQEALIALAPESATPPPHQSHEDKGLQKDAPPQELRETTQLPQTSAPPKVLTKPRKQDPPKQEPPRDPNQWHRER